MGDSANRAAPFGHRKGDGPTSIGSLLHVELVALGIAHGHV